MNFGLIYSHFSTLNKKYYGFVCLVFGGGEKKMIFFLTSGK